MKYFNKRSKLAPRNKAPTATTAPFSDKDQQNAAGSSSTPQQQQQTRFQFATPINTSNIVAVSSAPQQVIAAGPGRQQGQKPIQVNRIYRFKGRNFKKNQK